MSAQSPQINPDEYLNSLAQQEQNENVIVDGLATEENDEMFSGDMSNIEVWLKYKKFKLQKDNEDSERKLREENAKKAYKFSRNWAIFIAILIIIYGFIPRPYFKISQTEFMFVIGSLTASILTYYLLVIKYLFYRPKEKNNIE